MNWEDRLSKLWSSIDEFKDEEFIKEMESLISELPVDSSIALFELASAYDSTGHSDMAVPLYQQALDKGLDEERRIQAVIQLASSLRNVGQISKSISLLKTEHGSDNKNLNDEVSAFLALALADSGKESIINSTHSIIKSFVKIPTFCFQLC